MNIVFVGHMVASSNIFRALAEELGGRRGHEVALFVADGKDPFGVDFDFFADADILLVGMGSNPAIATQEIHACEVAKKHGTPYGMVSDTYNVYTREWFSGVREDARILFVVTDTDKKNAAKLFPSAVIVVSAPIRENGFFPLYSREHVREVFNIQPHEIVILAPAGKSIKQADGSFDSSEIKLHFESVVQAVSANRELFEKIKIFLSTHPGDPVGPDQKPEAKTYDYIVKEANRKKADFVRIVSKSVMSSDNVLPGIDMIVGYASGVAEAAMCQRKPVINFFPELILNHLEKQSGSREWPPVTLGAQSAVSSVEELTKEILYRLSAKGYSDMRVVQEKEFPASKEKGEAIRVMANVVEGFRTVRSKYDDCV